MTDLSLSTVANIAEIIGASTIVTGLIFGWIQLRQYRIQQRDSVASSLTQTFYSRDLAHAIALLQTIPDDVRLTELRTKGSEFVEAAVTVTTSFETMGILVFKRIAPLDLVVDLAGGIVTTMLRKLRCTMQDLRVEQHQPSWGEWFEWLGDQIGNVKLEQEPAHIRHRDWRP
jgi:hypothetical protein